MTGLEVLLALAGAAVTVLVIAGMILLTPRGAVDVHGTSVAEKDAERDRASGVATSR